MLSEIDPLLIFLMIAIITGVGMIVASQLIGPRKNTSVKLMPYESGMDPVGDARQRFDVRYYLIAIAFLPETKGRILGEGEDVGEAKP